MGSVGGVPVTATSSGDEWAGGFIDDADIFSQAAFGPLAAPVGTLGDAFLLNYARPETDTVVLTLGGTLVDPILYVRDADLVGVTITVDPPSVAFVNADGTITGNVLTVISGLVQGTPGASAAFGYKGTFGAGTTFTLEVDYSSTSTIGGDNVSITVATGIPFSVPEPGVLFLLAAAGIGVARRFTAA